MTELLGEIVIAIVIAIFAIFMVRPIYSSIMISAGKMADAYLEQQANEKLNYPSPHSNHNAAPL